MLEYLRTIVVAIIGGICMSIINAPLPWTLGPIVFIAVASLVTHRHFVWSLRVRNVALVLIGFAMGRPFTAETGAAIAGQLPLMLLGTVVTVGAGIVTAWLMFRHTEIDFTSCLLGCVPGGLSQMVILADEIEGTDLTAVTIMQTLRMLSVVFTIPFLTIHVLPAPGDGVQAVAHGETGSVLVFAVVAIVGALVARAIKLPTATMLGPILATAAFVVATGEVAPAVPIRYLNVAQLCVGSYIGTTINLARIRSYHGMGPVLLGGILLVLVVSMGMGYVISLLTSASIATAFLATAPGGLTEMGITALVVGADTSTMTAYQLVRLFFIMLVFPYIAKWIVKIYRRHTAAA